MDKYRWATIGELGKMFKNQLNPTKIILYGTCLFLLLLGCQPTINQGAETVLSTNTMVSEQEAVVGNAMTSAPTRSISPTATPTWTSVPTVVSSPTPQPTQTPLPTATATLTLWPTLSPDEAARMVLSLLGDNQNPDCLLPCWWGAIPGQTPWQDIEPFLRSFSIKIDTAPVGASVKLPVPEPIAIPGFGYYASYGWNPSGIIDEIVISPMNITGYDPQTMMTLYGVPDEVWLTTMDAPREGILPFQMIVVYQEQGISFRYYVNAASTYETVTACFESGVVELDRPDLFPVGPRIYLWEPGQYKTIEVIASIPGERYFPLAEKTDLTPQTLYEKFTDPNEQPCIDTSTQLWRSQ